MIQRLFKTMPLAKALLAALVLASFFTVGCAHTRTATPVAKAARHSELLPLRPLPAREEAQFEERLDALAHFATGVHHELTDNPAAAVEAFHKAALADLRNEALVLDAARRLVREQKNAEAIQLLEAATREPDPSGGYYAYLGLAYLQSGRTNEAMKANQVAIQKAPDNLAAYQNLAAIHLQKNETNGAVAVLLRAADRTNAPPEFLLGLSELFSRYNRQQIVSDVDTKKQVLKLLDAAAVQRPENPLIAQRIADFYLLHGEPDKAEPLYAELIRKYPAIPGLRERLANIYIRAGKNEEAAELLKAIQRENPTDPATYYFLGSIAHEGKDYEKAAEYFGTALKLNPDFEPLYYDLAGVHLARQAPAEALALLEKARSKFKLNFILEFYTGIAHASMDNWDDAVAHLSSAELIAKTSEPARLTHVLYFQLGSAHERAGDFSAAVQALRKCLELAPEFPDALNYLGYMWAERGENLEEARSMIEKAVASEPDNAAFLDSLAWVLFKLGRDEEALKHMERAVALIEEPDPTLFDHLGDIHARLKQFDKAREAYSKSLAVKPDEKIQEKLELLLAR